MHVDRKGIWHNFLHRDFAKLKQLRRQCKDIKGRLGNAHINLQDTKTEVL